MTGKSQASNDIDALHTVIQECADPALAYYRVLARRFLGLRHGADGRHDLAAAEYASALDEARRLHIDTEIGHLRRLLGTALRATGRLAEARHQFEQAYAYEQLAPHNLFTSYWQALSARELGDTIAMMDGRTETSSQRPMDAGATRDNPDQTLPEALAAYADGRLWFGGHISLQCPFPIARAAKQQLFRSFSANAMQVACFLCNPKEMLAEVEWNGPREVTELVTECAAARAMSPASLREFRLNRARYYATLNTWPARFEDYLAHLVDTWENRRAYLEQCFTLDSLLIEAQSSDTIAEQTLALRIPNTLFLLFHVGQRESIMVLVDASSGVAAPFPLPFGETTLQSIDNEYIRVLKDPGGTREAALNLLLSRYADLLGPSLEPLLPFLPGKHVKIFPRLHMNAVPFHALQIGGKHLIEHCSTVSYGQTLGLLLENQRAAPMPQPTSLRMVIGNHVPWYDLLLPRLRALYGSELIEEQQPDWLQLTNSLARQPTNDTLFACHGVFRSDNIEASRLDLGSPRGDGAVRFAQVFAELDLYGRRSVVMGACESGLVRTTVAAEYLGLASAMLSSGVRYVIGALWTIPEVATSALVDRYLELIRPADADVPGALCEAQRHVMGMTRASCAAWISALVPPGPSRDRVLDELNTKGTYPFAHPYHWAGLQVVGGL